MEQLPNEFDLAARTVKRMAMRPAAAREKRKGLVRRNIVPPMRGERGVDLKRRNDGGFTVPTLRLVGVPVQ
jgi:hypothetical protein